MYLMDYDSVKATNYVQRFCIIARVRNGVAEFTLLVRLVNNERTEVYEDTCRKYFIFCLLIHTHMCGLMFHVKH